MEITFEFLNVEFKAEIDVEVTYWGSADSYDEPGDAMEYNVKLLSIWSADDETKKPLNVDDWLKPLLENFFSEDQDAYDKICDYMQDSRHADPDDARQQRIDATGFDDLAFGTGDSEDAT